jgi:hypothetical protein
MVRSTTHSPLVHADGRVAVAALVRVRMDAPGGELERALLAVAVSDAVWTHAGCRAPLALALLRCIVACARPPGLRLASPWLALALRCIRHALQCPLAEVRSRAPQRTPLALTRHFDRFAAMRVWPRTLWSGNYIPACPPCIGTRWPTSPSPLPQCRWGRPRQHWQQQQQQKQHRPSLPPRHRPHHRRRRQSQLRSTRVRMH